MDWSYYRDRYPRRADAVAAAVPAMLGTDTIRQALALIDIAETAIDVYVERYLDIVDADGGA